MQFIPKIGPKGSAVRTDTNSVLFYLIEVTFLWAYNLIYSSILAIFAYLTCIYIHNIPKIGPKIENESLKETFLYSGKYINYLFCIILFK